MQVPFPHLLRRTHVNITSNYPLTPARSPKEEGVNYLIQVTTYTEFSHAQNPYHHPYFLSLGKEGWLRSSRGG